MSVSACSSVFVSSATFAPMLFHWLAWTKGFADFNGKEFVQFFATQTL